MKLPVSSVHSSLDALSCRVEAGSQGKETWYGDAAYPHRTRRTIPAVTHPRNQKFSRYQPTYRLPFCSQIPRRSPPSRVQLHHEANSPLAPSPRSFLLRRRIRSLSLIAEYLIHSRLSEHIPLTSDGFIDWPMRNARSRRVRPLREETSQP